MLIQINTYILVMVLDGLDDTKLTAEAEYSINFSKSNRKFCLGIHHNGNNSFLFVNATKM